jgi:tripartite-type tricarboxylate transporter receptor subunit TctC
VEYNPGGGYDAYSRAIARTMRKYLPQGIEVIVKNMPGAGGRTARTYMWRAKPDGHTLGLQATPGAVAEHAVLKEDVEYDFPKFTYFGRVAYEPGVVMVGKNTPYRSVEDLKNTAKPVRMSSTGVGSINMANYVIMGELLGFPYTIVSGYTTSAAMATALIRGDADMTMYNPSSALPFLQSGDLIGLWVNDFERFPLIPDIPSSKELGLPDDLSKQIQVVRFMYGPPNMPEPIVAYYKDLFAKVFADPEFLEWSEKAKRPLMIAGPEEAAKNVDDWVKLYSKYEPQIKAAIKKLGG